MLSRRGHRLSRFRKNKRHLRDRLRQRIFFRDRVVPELMEKPRVLVLTGAGISAESGIRTFRAADGLWEEHRVEDVATPEGFSRNPELVQSFYNARRHQLQQPEIQPNAAHIALAKLEAELGDRFLLVTQNIDNLHERAGSQIIKIALPDTPVTLIPNQVSPHILLAERLQDGFLQQGLARGNQSNITISVTVEELQATLSKPGVMYNSNAKSRIKLTVTNNGNILNKEYNRASSQDSVTRPDIHDLEVLLNEQLSEIMAQALSDNQIRGAIKGQF